MGHLTIILSFVFLAAIAVAAPTTEEPEILVKRVVHEKPDPSQEPKVIVRRAVDVIDQTKEAKRHPDELELTLRDEDGSDVKLRLRRGDGPVMTVANEEGQVIEVDVRNDETAYYEVLNDRGRVMVRSVEQESGVYKRSASGSFLHEDTAYALEEPTSSFAEKRDLDSQKHNLIKRFKLDSEKASRTKRSLGNLGIEVYVIIDNTVYSQFYKDAGRNKNKALSDIQIYFSHVMAGVDIRYGNIRVSDFTLYVRVTGIHVIDRAGVATFTESASMTNPGISDPNMINGQLVLEELKKWDNVNGRKFLTQSDHVMAFTKKNLYSVKNGRAEDGTVGIAFSKVLCTNSAYSCVEDFGVFQSEGVAAHELGHSLGASDHDGELSATGCLLNSKYIMAPSVTNSVDDVTYRNAYQFSTCSISQFRTYINSLGSNNCMSNKASHKPGWERPAGEMPGQIIDAVAQCQNIQGPDSRPCPFGTKLSDVCRGLSCTTNAQGTSCSTLHLAARGTSCGNNKWCDDNASCVSNGNAPAMDENCPYGDTPSGVNGQQCSSIVNSEPHKCYQAEVYGKCCASCKSIKENKPGCEYGDHEAFCSGLSGSQCTVGWNNWHCTCKKCAGVTLSVCKDDSGILFDNKQCNLFVTSSTKHKCYQSQVSQYCCESCKKYVSTSTPDCLFGDNDNFTFTLNNRQFTCANMRADPALKADACKNHSSASDKCCVTCR